MSGALREILPGVSMVGNDLVPEAGTCAPTFLVEGLVASGGAS